MGIINTKNTWDIHISILQIYNVSAPCSFTEQQAAQCRNRLLKSRGLDEMMSEDMGEKKKPVNKIINSQKGRMIYEKEYK